MNLTDIFPIAIGTKTLTSLTPDLIRRAIELVDKSERVDMGADGSCTSEQHFLDHPLLSDVKREVIDVCRELSRAYSHEVEDIGICNSWANIVGNGQSIQSHRHNNSYISGSLYLTDGSPISISNPTFLSLFGFMPRINDNNPRSWAAYLLKPEPGMVVVFPSGLQHGVTQSRSDRKRYSIAFNSIPLGEIGLPTSLIDLRMG